MTSHACLTWRLLSLVPILLLLGGCAPLSSTLEESPRAEKKAPFDASSAHHVLAQSVAAWSAGELERFMDAYAEDCLFISSSGLTRGKAEILARYKERYPDPAAMGALTLDIVETRPAPPDGLTLAARWGLAYPDRPAASGHTLIVMRRVEGRWLIVQDASM